MSELDVLIIGAGTAGQTAAMDLVSEGYRVTIVETSDTPGGTCALYGCQPKKWFYEVTELVARSRHLKGLGVTSPPAVSWAQVLEEKNRFTSEIASNTIASLKGNGIDFLEGEAVFLDPDTVSVGDRTFKPRFIIIATGAKPMTMPMEGSNFLATNRDFLALHKLPERIVLLGGGFISFEFAHFAARLGAKPENVQILEVEKRPLAPFDSDMVDQLVKATRAEGIQVRTEIVVTSISQNGDGYTVTCESGERIETDLVVHGAGRVPNIDALNLQAAGIDFQRLGIDVDGYMTTSNQKVFAIGDCAATIQLARVADQEAHVAAASIIARDHKETPEELDYQAVPAVLFTYPQLGMVGKTEDELIEEGTRYWKSSDKDLSWPTYSRIGMKHAAYKILVDEDGKILGAHVLADHTTGLINTFKEAMLEGLTVNELHRANIMSPYPSRESDIIYMLDSLLD
ncbi:MAG: dihydrolipoyl dehydrogenase family protein [Desulforhopalus sp.]